MTHAVIDDIVPVALQDQYLLDTHKFKWDYLPNTCWPSYNSNIEDTSVYDVGHLTYPVVDSFTNSSYIDTLHPLITALQLHIGTFTKLHRVKYNMLWRCKDVGNRTAIPHVDGHNKYDPNIWSIIYYVNDSDGDTKLFYPDHTVTISPKKGRVLIFAGHVLHAGTNPTNSDNRIVLNMVVNAEHGKFLLDNNAR